MAEKNTALMRFTAASGLTNLADGVALVAWAWAASLLTRDPLLIATLPMALRLPWFLCAIPAGLVTDRVDRKRLILWMDGLRGLCFALAAFAFWVALPLDPAPANGLANPMLFSLLILAATCVGTAEVFRDNAAQTMLPALVAHVDLERANGRLWSIELVGNALLGPALGAILISLSLPLPFALNACAYLVAIALLLRLGGSFKPQNSGKSDWRSDLKAGYEYLRGSPLLQTLAIVTGIWNLLFQTVEIGLILHVQENLNLTARAYGLILACGALGGILGGFLGARIVTRFGPSRTARWMLASSAPSFLCVALAPNGPTLGLVLMLFTFSGLVWNTVSVSYRQRSIPDELLGRVNSLYRLLAWGMMPIGLLGSGLIVRASEALMSRSDALLMPFYAGAIGALLLSLLSWRALKF